MAKKETETRIRILRPEESSFADAIAQPQQYSTSLQGKGINGLISSSTARGNLQVNPVNQLGTMESDGVTIIIDEEAIQGISAQTFKALILLLTKATAQLPRADAITAEAIHKGRAVKISLDEYMAACNLQNRKEARGQLNASIRALYGVSLEWDEEAFTRPEGKSRRRKELQHHRMRITDHTITPAEGNPVQRGTAEVRLSYDMAEYLAGAYIMPYPAALLTINTHRHPHSLPLGWKLCALYNMNYGKPRQNTTTVKTLLGAAKGIPRYSDLARTGQIYERLIGPFDRDMRALVGKVLKAYHYYGEDGEPIPSDQLGLISYAEFEALHVYFEMIDNYPDQTPRLETKSRRIKAAISRRKNTAKKNAEEEG